ncbi:hypothetical protein KIPB_009253 [Kipferlia bialata]|uniref:Uncharacterized protein n=1 Tax=Kipferlia bialata TaxID=797122 RepID=A0A9K3GLZ4_9EUKA|nr:hypothetical protein KIPB_009253 [Kipferlia bialata]|eukprot:g9253.t1
MPLECLDVRVPSREACQYFMHTHQTLESVIAEAVLKGQLDTYYHRVSELSDRAYPLTHLAVHIVEVLSLLDTEQLGSLTQVLMAVEPLIWSSGRLYVDLTTLSLYCVLSLLEDIHSTHRGWFTGGTSLALLVSSFCCHVDILPMSDCAIAALNNPVRYLYGERPTQRHACSVFLLLEQMCPLKGVAPGWRGLVRDIMVGGYSVGDMPNLSLPDTLGSSLVSQSDPGSTTPTGVTLRRLLPILLQIVGRSYLWAARRDNEYALIDHGLGLRDTPLEHTSLNGVLDSLCTVSDGLERECQDLAAFLKVCVPEHHSVISKTLHRWAKSCRSNLGLFKEWVGRMPSPTVCASSSESVSPSEVSRILEAQ